MTHYHLIGIGGTGLSAIARILFEKGHQVSGSDMALSPLAEDLIEMGIKVDIGHDANNVASADVVIHSSAIPASNPEIQAALSAGIPVLKRKDFLSTLTENYKVVAVAGTHGKTTTTAMIAWCLLKLDEDPSYVVGGTMKNLGNNAHAGQGDYFAIEADEYDYMFHGLAPDILVITNIEHDHPDCFPTESEYQKAFFDLIQKIKPGGTLIAFSDNPAVKQMLGEIEEKVNVITYGSGEDCTYKIGSIHHVAENGIEFSLFHTHRKDKILSKRKIALSIPGTHNAYNASAVMAVLDLINLPSQKAIHALAKFSGTGRRFDILGKSQGIILIDDYAHHPTEIKATLAAARNQYPQRNIWAIWQPHTYSRTKQLFNDFVESFANCDHVIVTEIYASREKPQPFSSKSIVEEMDHADARYIAQVKDVTQFLKGNLKKNDVLLVLTAGDANQITSDILGYLDRKESL